MKIITATGKEFRTTWCAISSIDGLLRFSIIGVDIAAVIGVFMRKEETGVIMYIFDESQKIFKNYTVFKGANVEPDGSVVIALSR